MSIDQLHRAAEEKMTDLIARQAASLDPEIPAILTCHVSTNDWLIKEKPGSELFMTVGVAPTLNKSSLHEANFDYIALGHHHNNADLTNVTPRWYSGSMQAVDFGEKDQPKGFMILDIDPSKRLGSRVYGSGLPRLCEVPNRRFVEVKVRAKTADPTGEVIDAIRKAGVRDSIVKVIVEAGVDQARDLRIPQVRAALDEAHTVAAIQTLLPADRRLDLPAGVQPDAAVPMEALEIYLKLRKDLADDRRQKLLAAAEDLIASVDGVHA
jgi:exonuclease SbcD